MKESILFAGRAFMKLFGIIRRRFWTAVTKLKVASYGKGLTVNYPCYFTRTTHIGEDCHFNGIRVAGAGILKIGDHFHSGIDILIITQNHNYYSPTALPYDEKDILKDVHIGHAVWLGSRVTLLPGTRLGDGVVVQAGSVVVGSVPDCAVIGGNPAKVIKYRDREKYVQLVEAKRYLGWSA